MSRPLRNPRQVDNAGIWQYERLMAPPEGVTISVGDYWPVAAIAIGVIATAIWIGIIGWGAVVILSLVFG